MNNDVILVVGLGNPGERFQANRHNIGFITVDYLAKTRAFNVGYIKVHYPNRLILNPPQVALNRGIPIQWKIIGNKTVVLLKPQTYMNNSGIAVAAAQSVLQVPQENILVIHDDTAFDFGDFRLKNSGGAGGHKGVRSVIDHLGYEDIVRLRIGIGKPKEDQTLIDYVLSDFTVKEQSYFCDMCLAVTGIIDRFVGHGGQQTMNTFNQRKQ